MLSNENAPPVSEAGRGAQAIDRRNNSTPNALNQGVLFDSRPRWYGTGPPPGARPPSPPPTFPLGGEAPAQRHSETSTAAGAEIDRHLPRLQALVLRFVLACAERGATDSEIAAGTRLSSETSRPRRVELVNLGRVVDSGRRRSTPSGRSATVWLAAAFTR